MKGNLAVVISYHLVDSFISKKIPSPGETVLAEQKVVTMGGKGTTQAYAARLLGAQVEALGRVGDDAVGQTAFAQLEGMGIGTQYLVKDPEHETGHGVVFRDMHGENAITVYQSASDHFAAADFAAALPWLQQCAVCGFQFEVNCDTVLYGLKCAQELGVATFLDPAPVPDQPLPEELFRYVDYIKPNEHEAKMLTGVTVVDVASACKAGQILLEKGVKRAVVVTLGAEGAVLVTADGHWHYPAPDVVAVNTAGAGDSFAGGFVYGLANQEGLHSAMVAGCCLSAVRVTKMENIQKNVAGYQADYAVVKEQYLTKLQKMGFVEPK